VKQTPVKRVLTEVDATPTFRGDPVGIERVSCAVIEEITDEKLPSTNEETLTRLFVGSNSISKLERGVEEEGVLLITNTLEEEDKSVHDVEHRCTWALEAFKRTSYRSDVVELDPTRTVATPPLARF
jgi:hypothetical protein